MSFENFFQSAPSISPDEVRSYIASTPAPEFCLLDVRQPMENAQTRLPGSVLIPLGELNLRVGELDPAKPTIVYCRSGQRSVAATNFLLGEGFNEVLNMTGGIIRYNGMVASGPPEAASACFSAPHTPGQMAATAWVLEAGTIQFIEYVCDEVLDGHEPALFDRILAAKRAHQVTLTELVAEVSGERSRAPFPGGEVEMPDEPVMIGCIKVSDGIAWAAGKRLKDLLEMMMTLSANAYDFYLRLVTTAKADEELKVFEILAREEHQFLERLAEAYDRELTVK